MRSMGRYSIEELVGAGPLASVYRAGSGSETVALKVLHPQLASDGTLRERFRRETLDARALKHPGIVQVYDFVETEEGCAAVEEFCPGGDLERWKAPDAAELEAMAAQVAAALDCAHSRGAVHRNLKPSNILRGADGSFKIADFGSAGLQDLVGLTATTSFLGRPQFMPPESLDRPYPDPRWDLYSLGACLYLAGTGKSHADRSMQDLFSPARAVLPPRSLEPSLPEYLDAVILSLLGPVGGRPRTAAELLSILEKRGAAPRKSKECLFCGADMPKRSSVCPACMNADPDLSPTSGPSAKAVVVTKVGEEAETIKELRRIMKIVSGDPGKTARFITEDARMYSKAERERYAAMPCRLIDSLQDEEAELLASLIERRTGGKAKANAWPMQKAVRRAKNPPLVAACPRFKQGRDRALAAGRDFERSALARLGGAPAVLPGAAGMPQAVPAAGEAPLRRKDGADLALAARNCLSRAQSMGREADDLKAGLMDIVAKASALMDRLGEARARLDAVSLPGIYAQVQRLEGTIAAAEGSLAEEAMREKARLFESYQRYKELEREICLLNQRVLSAAASLDALASGPVKLSAGDLLPVAAALSG